MLLNYLKLSLRLLLRNPFLTIINVVGLAVGLATFLLLWPIAEFELNSDRFHADSDRIVRVGVDYKWKDNENWDGLIGAFNWLGVGHEIEQTFPQVESATWLVPQGYFREDRAKLATNVFISIIDSANERVSFRETQTAFAQSNFFTFFTFPLIEGDPSTVLQQPKTVVLSETIAAKYFLDKEATGQTIYVNDTIPMLVSGVFKNLPNNTHFKFDLVFSSAGINDVNEKTWTGWFANCYFKLKPGVTAKSFDQALAERQPLLYDFVKSGCSHCNISPYTQPLTDVIFTNLRGNVSNYKSKYLLEALSLVAFVVLIFAWINYITLTVNSLNKRLTEIGTRKGMGALIDDFFIQFLIDSAVMNVISFGVAITLVQVIGTIAEEWFDFYIPSWDEISLKTTMVILSTLGIGVLIATLYPLALVVKRKPYELLKKLKRSIRSGAPNSILVTTQYIVAIVMLICIVAVYFQLNFIINRDIGIKRDGLIVIEGPLHMDKATNMKIESFLLEAKRISGISHTTLSHSAVGEGDAYGIDVQSKGSSVWFGADSNGGVDASFLDTHGIPLIAGRNFQQDNPSDEKHILVSQALVKRLGLPSSEDALGKKVILKDQDKEAEIIGVFKDYEVRPFFNEMKEDGRGIALTYKNFLVPNFKARKFTMKVDLENLKSELEAVEKLYTNTFQESFSWSFVDEKIRMHYANEQANKNKIAFFCVLAIGIACLGLLGMITNKAIEKTKEIGIRKVLGAQMFQIARLLLNTTMRQIVIANILGIPIAYYLVEQYLQKFSERLDLQWWHYALPIAVFMTIMLTTIASVIVKAARTNPADSLRYE